MENKLKFLNKGSWKMIIKEIIFPERDWFLILLIGMLIVLIMTIFNSILFVRIYKGEIFTIQNQDSGSMQVVNKTELGKIIKANQLKIDKNFEIRKTVLLADPMI